MALPALIAALAADKVDLLYLPPDSFLNSQRDVLTDTRADAAAGVRRSRGTGSPERYSAWSANTATYWGRFTAYRAAQILYGQTPGDLPIELPRRFSPLLINLDVARASCSAIRRCNCWMRRS